MKFHPQEQFHLQLFVVFMADTLKVHLLESLSS